MSEPSQALFRQETPPPPEPETVLPAKATKDVAMLRTEAVASLLHTAYEKASTLELSPQERQQLLAEFPDEAVRRGAGGDDDLIYIEHAYIRERLLQVFGPGAWSEVPRRIWGEDIRTSKGGMGTRLYADVVLLIRGCYVGEAIGAGTFYKDNPKQNYSDAAEAAQSEAVRRIANKKLGIGIQVYKKAWCEAWKERQNKPKSPAFTQPAPAAPVIPTKTHFTAKVESIERKESATGKKYNVLRFPNDPKPYSTWHAMEGVKAGGVIEVDAECHERNGTLNWSIVEYKSEPSAQQVAAAEVGGNLIKTVRGLCQKNKVKESELLGFLAEIGTCEYQESLEDLALVAPNALMLVNEQFADIVQKLAEAKVVPQ